jgi:hypothetical protein
LTMGKLLQDPFARLTITRLHATWKTLIVGKAPL